VFRDQINAAEDAEQLKLKEAVKRGYAEVIDKVVNVEV
jgi:hypothetical protein